jgi:hypothetical protein
MEKRQSHLPIYRFYVTTFGAVPNDEKSDKPAIEKAIRAAELVESI